MKGKENKKYNKTVKILYLIWILENINKKKHIAGIIINF
jgi:hypothetical protein